MGHGRDRYLRLAATQLRQPAIAASDDRRVARIAGQCDGVRCDMAMLSCRTCSKARGASGTWPKAIESVRRKHPDFQLMAEVYWDREWTMPHGCYVRSASSRRGRGPGSRSSRVIIRNAEPRPGALDMSAPVCVFDPGSIRGASSECLGDRARSRSWRPARLHTGRDGNWTHDGRGLRARRSAAAGDGELCAPQQSVTVYVQRQSQLATVRCVELGRELRVGATIEQDPTLSCLYHGLVGIAIKALSRRDHDPVDGSHLHRQFLHSLLDQVLDNLQR